MATEDFDPIFAVILENVEGAALMRKSNHKVQREFPNQEDEFDEMKFVTKSKPKTMKTGGPKKKKKKKTDETKKKKMTKWATSKLSKSELEALDRSERKSLDDQSEEQLEELRQQYIGSEEEIDDEEEEDQDSSAYESDKSSGSETSNRWSFGKTSLGGFLQSISGNKTLDRDDLVPVAEKMRTQVASIALHELERNYSTCHPSSSRRMSPPKWRKTCVNPL